jgi:hypothetical protein
MRGHAREERAWLVAVESQPRERVGAANCMAPEAGRGQRCAWESKRREKGANEFRRAIDERTHEALVVARVFRRERGRGLRDVTPKDRRPPAIEWMGNRYVRLTPLDSVVLEGKVRERR